MQAAQEHQATLEAQGPAGTALTQVAPETPGTVEATGTLAMQVPQGRVPLTGTPGAQAQQELLAMQAQALQTEMLVVWVLMATPETQATTARRGMQVPMATRELRVRAHPLVIITLSPVVRAVLRAQAVRLALLAPVVLQARGEQQETTETPVIPETMVLLVLLGQQATMETPETPVITAQPETGVQAEPLAMRVTQAIQATPEIMVAEALEVPAEMLAAAGMVVLLVLTL